MIQSNTVTANNNTKQFSFSYGSNAEVLNIDEPLLNNSASAEKRAITEFMKRGMLTQTVTFTTYFVDLQINDIISLTIPEKRIPKELNKDRFIVKEVTHNITDKSITTTLRVERYD